MKKTYSEFIEEVLMPRYHQDNIMCLTIEEAEEYRKWLVPLEKNTALTFKDKNIIVIDDNMEKGYYRDDKGIIKRIKVVVNLTKGKGGWTASAHFTYLTSHGKTREQALSNFIESLKLRNYEINETRG